MNLCSDKHDDICYEARFCPLCAKLAEHKQDLEEKETHLTNINASLEQEQATVETLRAQNDTQRGIIESLQAKLAECEAANPVARHTHELEKGKNVW